MGNGNKFDVFEILEYLDSISLTNKRKDIKKIGDDNAVQKKSKEMVTDIDNLNISEKDPFELIKILETLSNDDKVRFFDRILERIKENSYDLYMTNELILSLPPDIRIKYAEYYDFESFDSINKFVLGIKNEDDIFCATKIWLNKTVNKNCVIRLFSAVPNNKKIEFLELIAVKEKELQINIIDRYNIDEYLRQFNIEQRLDIIENVIFKEFQIDYEEKMINNLVPNVRFDPYSYSDILSSFSDENNIDLSQSKMFESLVFLTCEGKKIYDSELNEVIGIVGSELIVKMFYEQGYNPNEIIEFLINSNAINSKIGLCDIVNFLPLQVRKDAINFMINMDNEERKLSQFEFFYLLDHLPLSEASNFFVKYCLIDKRFDYLEVINRLQQEERHSSLDYLNIIFKNLSKEELETSFEKIRIAFSEIEIYPKYDEKYDLIVSVFSEKYNLDEMLLLPFVRKFGYNILKYLENENIRKFINTDTQSLEKLFNLFCNDTIIMNKSVTNDILNSLLQRQFMLEEREIYNIFAKFENLVQDNDLNGINELLEKIFKEFDYSLILEQNNSSIGDLYNQIIAGNLDLLHVITDAYIAYKREMFVKEKLPTVSELLSMEKVITRDSYKNDILKNHAFCIAIDCKQLVNVNFTEDQKHLIDNDNLLWELIQFKNDPKGYNLDNKSKKYLRVLNELLDIMYDNKVNFMNYNADFNLDEHLKYEFIQGEISNDFLVGILLESNYEGVMNLLSNDNNYFSLKSYLEKYKMVGWQDIFVKLMAKGDIQFDEGTVGSLISNYDKIKPYVDNKASLTSIIDYANCYSTVSFFYRMLFGIEDYNLLAANAGKNKASMSKYDRLNGCRDLVPLMYAKKKFTVPTFDKIFTLKNGHEIQVILGNATNMMNLTYGERTDACMREGGAFKSLFKHCATDKNGFHIRFINPKTGNFVSRVSGTRNGNTVFLNELRKSLDSEYSNEDLYEVSKMLSRYLVQLSKDSKMPIDNIIVTSDYALEEHKRETQSLNLSPEERKEALRAISFNYNDSGILLANSKKSDKIMPYVFSDNLPIYDSLRDNVKVYYGKGAVNRMIQIRMINDIINGVSNENINTEHVLEIPDYVVSGEDYYVAYSKGNVHTFILDSCKENPRTIAEVNNILKNNTDEFMATMQKGVSR